MFVLHPEKHARDHVTTFRVFNLVIGLGVHGSYAPFKAR